MLFSRQSNVSSVGRSVAIAGDNLNSPINIGLDEDGVRSILQQELTRIAEDRGVPLAPLMAILAKLGENFVSRDQVPALLEAKADELLALRNRLARLTSDRPEFAAIRELGSTLVQNGEFEAARKQFQLGRRAAQEILKDAGRREAEFIVDEARVDQLQFEYQAAAIKYLEAAEIIAPYDVVDRVDYLQRSSAMLYYDWDQFGNEGSLRHAEAVLRQSATLVSRESHPKSWATIHMNLGIVLHGNSERDGSVGSLKEAVLAFKASLKALPIGSPILRASAQHGLGHAILDLGEAEDNLDSISDAVSILRQALNELPREQDTSLWTSIQNNLGSALLELGKRQQCLSHVTEAVRVYAKCLEVWTYVAAPENWAMVHVNIGNANQALGTFDERSEPLQHAVMAYRSSLRVFAKTLYPMHWALAQNNLGNALAELGCREHRIDLIEEGVEALRASLLERPRNRMPALWADTQANLGLALEQLAAAASTDERPSEFITSILDEAVVAYRAALEGDALSPKRRNAVQQTLENINALRDFGRALSQIP